MKCEARARAGIVVRDGTRHADPTSASRDCPSEHADMFGFALVDPVDDRTYRDRCQRVRVHPGRVIVTGAMVG